jgi:hypothetical protein
LSVQVSYPGAQAGGNLNIVVVGWGNAAGDVAAVTDSLGNSYQRAVGPTRNANPIQGLSQSIYYAASIRSGSNTVTVNFTQAVNNADVRVLEYQGVSVLDAFAELNGDSNLARCGPVGTSADNELIVAANIATNGSSGAGPGFTERIRTADNNSAQDRVAPTPGSYEATVPLSGSGPWVMQMACFKGS